MDATASDGFSTASLTPNMNSQFGSSRTEHPLSGLRAGAGPAHPFPSTQNFQQHQQYAQQAAVNALPYQQQQQLFGGLATGGLQQSFEQAYMQLQQNEFNLQLQQIKMTNLALQEHIARQQQQALLLAQQQQQQQHEQQAQSQPQHHWNKTSPPFHSRQLSAGTQQQGHEPQIDSATARRGALRDLQQLRRSRDLTSLVQQDQVPDWQSERLRFVADGPNTVEDVAKSIARPSTSDSQSPPIFQQASNSSNKDIRVTTGLTHHRKSSSVASNASGKSSNTVASNSSLYSPNKGPALVLSKPGEDYPEDDDETSPTDLRSPALHTGFQNLSLAPIAEGQDESVSIASQAQVGNNIKKKPSRHMLILKSTLPQVPTPTLAQQRATKQRSDSLDSKGSMGNSASETSSTGSSSPTSDRSDVPSFESSATAGTSVTAVDDKEKDVLPAPGNPRPARRNFTTPNPHQRSSSPGPCLNPNAATFAPNSLPAPEKYPASLSASPSKNRSLPLRLSSAPPMPYGNAASISIVRQPKGPPSETEIKEKFFIGMKQRLERRKAVDKLRQAATFGGRPSPMASPVLGSFPVHSLDLGLRGPQRLSSPPQGGSLPSPPLVNNVGFAGLAERAMKRRSAQMMLPDNFNLGMT